MTFRNWVYKTKKRMQSNISSLLNELPITMAKAMATATKFIKFADYLFSSLHNFSVEKQYTVWQTLKLYS